MHPAFSQSKYVLKQRGLSIGGKYRIYGQDPNAPLLYVEEKMQWIPPSATTHIYTDEKQQQELLRLEISETLGAETDIIDAETGQTIGRLGITVDNVAEMVKDAWTIQDAEGKPIAKMFETSAGQSIARNLLDRVLPQRLDITVGETLVAELRQKSKMIGYEMSIDFSMDIVRNLDRRLGIAAAVFIALIDAKKM
jgi:hypothetical protein